MAFKRARTGERTVPPYATSDPPVENSPTVNLARSSAIPGSARTRPGTLPAPVDSRRRAVRSFAGRRGPRPGRVAAAAIWRSPHLDSDSCI